jgi:hypothetical protein
MHRYRCIDYYDRWKDIEGGWSVNDLCVVEDDILFDVDDCTDRELYKLFARIAGYKPGLRAIEIEGDYDYFIEFVYTAQAVNGFFPLGRFERTD